MKDYYEVLEVSRNASQEVIEKAYKTLAKKYHPDVQEPDNVKNAEERFKEIGEAYETLSDSIKRSEYDFIIKESEINNENESTSQGNSYSYESTNEAYTYTPTQEDSNDTDSYSNNNKENYSNVSQINEELQNLEMKQAVEKAYHDAYIERLKSFGFRIRYKKTFKQKLKNFITLIITFLIVFIIGFILWKIPSVKNYIINFYQENAILKLILSPFIK